MDAFEVIAEQTRRRIIDLLLLRGPLDVGQIVEELGLGQSNTSKHLGVLRSSGWVEVDVRAQRRVYRLAPAPIASLDAWLSPHRERWARHLDALEAHLDSGAPGANRSNAARRREKI